MIARSASGRRAAIWSALKPPQDLPIIPTAPVHHGWAASHSMTATPSSSSCSWYSSRRTPSESPAPHTSTRAAA